MSRIDIKRYCLFVFTSILLYKSVQIQSCQQKINSIDMCGDVFAIGNQFYVYHKVLPFANDITCRCAITLKTEDEFSVTLSDVPSNPNCGSSIQIIANDKTTDVYCNSAPGIIVITKHTLRIQAQTKAGSVTALFCIYLESFNSANITIKCGSSLTTFTALTPPTSTSLLTTTTTTAAAATTSTTITTTQSTQSTKSVLTTNSDQSTYNSVTENMPRFTSTTKSTFKPDSSVLTTTAGDVSRKQLPLNVVIPSTVGGVGLVLVVVVIAACIRKRKLNKYKSKSKSSATRSEELRQYDNKGMENDDDDEMRVNIFYESYDDVPKKEKQHVFDHISSGYSEVGLIQTTDQRNTYHKKDDGYSEVKLKSAERLELKYSDKSGYSEGEIPYKEKRNLNTEDISFAYDEGKLSSKKTYESANDVLRPIIGDEVKLAKTCDFPIYSMPDKSSKKTTNNEPLTDSFPIYALPDKKKKLDNKTNSNTGGSAKPIIKPKPKPKAEQLPTNHDHVDNVNADGLKYSDVQFQENNPTKRKPFLPVQKTEYAEIL